MTSTFVINYYRIILNKLRIYYKFISIKVIKNTNASTKFIDTKRFCFQFIKARLTKKKKTVNQLTYKK